MVSLPQIRGTRPDGDRASLAETAIVPAAGGVELATDVHLPGAVGDGVPALLLRTPYGRSGEVDRVRELAQAATSSGLALVAQDVRGRFGSTGETLPFVHEEADGAATVEWLTKQSWSNGRIVTVGDSYSGYTASAAAASGADSVVGAVARVTSLDPYGEWLHRDGVFRLDLALPWLGFAFGDANDPLQRPDWTDPFAVGQLVAALPTRLQENCLLASTGGPWDRAARLDPARIGVPVLHWAGWWDCLGRGQWADIRRRSAARAGSRDGLIAGPTDHEFHTWTRPADAAEQAEALVEQADRVLGLLLAGQPLPRVVTPARGARAGGQTPRTPGVLYLRDAGRALLGPEGGALATRPDALASSAAWIHDPASPVPAMDGWVWGPLRDGLHDETRIQVREDVATFTGAEQRRDELLAGRIRLTVRVGSEQAAWHLVVALTDVAMDGSATRVTDGVTLVDRSADWQTVAVDLGLVAYQLRAGHRLRLSLAASAYPRYPAWPSPRSGPWWLEQPPPAHEVRVQAGPGARLEIEAVPELDVLLGGQEVR